MIMPDHFHVVTDGGKEASLVQRFINGITSRRVIDFLKQEGTLLRSKSSGMKSIAAAIVIHFGIIIRMFDY